MKSTDPYFLVVLNFLIASLIFKTTLMKSLSILRNPV